MHREATEEFIECADCRTLLEPDSPSFTYAPDQVLCMECAARRGGLYDSASDRWLQVPDVSGLPDERRPHL